MEADMRRLSLLLAVIALFLPGCASRFSSEETAGVAAVPDSKHYGLLDADKSANSSGSAGRESAKSSTPSSAEAKSTSAETKIVKTARIDFQVDSIEKSKKQISQLVDTEKGYISNLEETSDGRRMQASFTIRVPAAGFDRLVENVLKQASYVNTSKIERRDVTEEYLDLKARMETEKAMEVRFREILHQAKSIKEILELETAIGELREKIEAKEGRMKYLAHQSEYSTISALVYQTLPYTRPPRSEDERFFSRLKSSLANGWAGLVEFIIGLATIWPAWIIIGGGTYLILRLIKRNKRLNRSADKKNAAIIPEQKK
jgi:hypothetical protein